MSWFWRSLEEEPEEDAATRFANTLLGSLKIELGHFGEFEEQDGKNILQGWKIDGHGTLENFPVFTKGANQKVVFVVGAFDIGKSKLIELLAEVGLTISHEVRNTLGEMWYDVMYPGGDRVIFVDTEGLFQYNGASRATEVETFLMEHIAVQCDVLIYVQERTFPHESLMIEKLNSLYEATDSPIKRFLVVHNYRNIRLMDELRMVVRAPANLGLLIDECAEDGDWDYSCLGNGFEKAIGGGKKKITHFVLGCDSEDSSEEVRQNNLQIIKKIRNILTGAQSGSATFWENIKTALLRTLYRYCDVTLPSLNAEEQPDVTTNLELSQGLIEILPFAPNRRYKVVPRRFDQMAVQFQQYCNPGLRLLHVFVFCAGLVQDAEHVVEMKPITTTYAIVTLVRGVGSYFLNSKEFYDRLIVRADARREAKTTTPDQTIEGRFMVPITAPELPKDEVEITFYGGVHFLHPVQSDAPLFGVNHKNGVYEFVLKM